MTIELCEDTKHRLQSALEQTMKMRAQINRRPAWDDRHFPPTPNEVTTRLLANQEALLEDVGQIYLLFLDPGPSRPPE